MHHKENAKKLFQIALATAQPKNIDFDLSGIPTSGKITLLGSGKASLEMAKALQKKLRGRIKKSFIVSNYYKAVEGLEIFVSSHPAPTNRSIDAGERILHGIQELEEDDFFIYLLSGGSSALIEKPIEPITLEELQLCTRLLLSKSASIDEINIVRKHLSMIKGGRLGHATKASGIVFVISDVIGDDLEVIGSAPLFYDHSTCADAQKVLTRYALWKKVPKSIQNVIESCHHESPKVVNPNIEHRVIASNMQCLQTMYHEAQGLGYETFIITDRLSGNVKEVAKYIISEVRAKDSMNPVCLLFGGESTVEIKGKGKGGRNQELALWVLKQIQRDENITFLSAGTDGIDGQSDAAGTVVNKEDYRDDIDLFLEDNDSYHYLQRDDNLITIGDSGTNVMDIMIAIKE